MTAFTSVAALVDHRRSGHRSDVVARQFADWAHVALTLLEVRDRANLPYTPADVRVELPRDAVGPAVTANLRSRDGVLLVVDAHGGGPPGDELFDDDVEYILQHLRRPTLVLGPDARDLRHAPHLLVPVDRGGLATATLEWIESWVERIPSTSVSVLALDVIDSWPDGSLPPPPDDADELVRVLQGRAASVTLHRTDGSNPAPAVIAACGDDTIIVAVSTPWPSAPSHWFATTRRLIRHAPAPVLVVPTSA